MKVLIEIPVEHYDRLVEKCWTLSRSHSVLKNGVIVRHKKAGYFERVVQIDCTTEEGRGLLEVAKRICPDIAPAIEKAITTPRDS